LPQPDQKTGQQKRLMFIIDGVYGAGMSALAKDIGEVMSNRLGSNKVSVFVDDSLERKAGDWNMVTSALPNGYPSMADFIRKRFTGISSSSRPIKPSAMTTGIPQASRLKPWSLARRI